MFHSQSASLFIGLLVSVLGTVVSTPLAGQTHLARVQALKLDSLVTTRVVTYFSSGQAGRAQLLSAALEGMAEYYANVRAWDVRPRLAVLSENDWRQAVENPYGVPAMRQPGPIAFMPASVTSGVVYRDFVAIGRNLSAALRSSVTAGCRSLEQCSADGADGIVFHELGHMYQGPAGIGSPAYWFNEFVADYIAYAYLRARAPPQTNAYMTINRLTSYEPPQFASLDAFERGIEQALPSELGRLHGVFTERIMQVYDRQGLLFLDSLAVAFPVARHPFGCGETPPPARGGSVPPMSRSWIGLCDESVVATQTILERLEAIEPGFIAWAQRFAEQRK